MMTKNKTGKTKPSDKVLTVSASLIAQVEAAKTVGDLKAVIELLLKRLGMG